jgi:outer membrane protein OmpU
MSVTGSAGITLVNQSNADQGNSFSSGDSLNFTGSGELDNGFIVTSNVEIDGGNEDDRSISVEIPGAGEIEFKQSASTAYGSVDDVTPTAYGESWDVIGFTKTTDSGYGAGQALKQGAISDFDTGNMFYYTAPTMVEGLGVEVSYVPSGGTRPDGSISYGLEYTGVEGLTIGYAEDDNGKKGSSKLEVDTMYAKYAIGSFTFGVQQSEQEQSSSSDGDDEFSAIGVTYQVSEDLTIGYNESERQFGDKTEDQEAKNFSVSYTTGGVTIGAAMVSMDNVGGSSAARDDIDGYEIDISFAF